MKKKLLLTILVLTILFNACIMVHPSFNNVSYAADMSVGTLSRDINAIDNNLYPGYKQLIQSMQSKHPNYTFLVYYTGMDWNQVLVSEYQGHGRSPVNLFQKSDTRNGMWICPLCGDRNYDNGSLCCASLESIAYMMDPRNSINDDDVFQFKDLEGADVSYADIQRVVSGYGGYINNAEVIQAIVDASNMYNINGYFLVAKIINEHGKNGTTLSNGGGYQGNYAGVYNYFNIGAYGNGTAAIINNGLSYALSQGWTSRRASILGGARVVRESYITRYSQNTLYYQKFNVSGKSEIASHQYQQNIMAAQSQGSSLKGYYGDAINSKNFTFIIPLYKNMPSTASARPKVTVANSITTEDGVVQNISSSLKVRSGQGLSALAIGKLNNNEEIRIIRRASSQVDGYYWDLIVSKVDGTYGYAARSVGGSNCIVGRGTNQTTSGSTGSSEPDTPTQPPVEKKLSSIVITKAPNKTTYTEGEKFSTAGMVVAAKYTDNTQTNITNYTYSPNGELKTSDKTITISYSEGGVTKTVTQNITVQAKPTPPPEPLPEPEVKALEYDDELHVIPQVTVESLEKYYEGKTIEVKNSKGEEITEGSIGTGYTVKIDENEYVVVKKADVDGNANINVVDIVATINHIKNTKALEGVYLEAALVKNTETVSVVDIVSMINYIKGTSVIEIK